VPTANRSANVSEISGRISTRGYPNFGATNLKYGDSGFAVESMWFCSILQISSATGTGATALWGTGKREPLLDGSASRLK
jgi:hypothetical protein